MNTPANLDAAAIQALVAEVIRRIAAGQAETTAASAERPKVAPSAGVPAGHAIAERVVTLASIERIPAGAGVVAAVANAVITPSAADRARERGITIVRGPAGVAAPVASRPFLIARAGSSAHASARAASIARAVPAAQQLPATGLADVIASLAGHASRDAARGILLTATPALAVAVANRSASLRAVTARDAASLAAAAAETAANLLVVDPATFPGTSLERLCAEFHRSPAATIPAELAATSPGCGCTTHPH